MHNKDLREFVRRVPFIAFDIRMSDGRTYRIEHPEWVSISPSGRALVTWTVEDERLILLDTAHVTSLEIANRPAVA